MKHLPVGEPVGFLNTSTSDKTARGRLYYSTKYSLAPILVRHDTDGDYVIAWIAKTDAAGEIAARYKMRLIEQTDEGVALFGRIRK
jgi:hypothetical protein